MIAVALIMVLHSRGRSAPAPPPEHTSSDSVRLLVEHDGRGLRLRWNPEAPPIRAASHAVLYVNDGVRESRLPLEKSELRGGTASYFPQGKDVTFRLQLADGPSGEIRVSSEPRPSPFQAEPKPPALAVQTPPAAISTSQPKESDRSEEDPRATYTRYWSAQPTATAPSRAPEPEPAPVHPPSSGSAARVAPHSIEPPRAQAALPRANWRTRTGAGPYKETLPSRPRGAQDSVVTAVA